MNKDEFTEQIVKAIDKMNGVPEDKDDAIKFYRRTIAELNLELKIARNKLERASTTFYNHGYNDAVKQIKNFISRHMGGE